MRRMALDLLARYCGDRERMLLLDAGCGTGLFLREVEKRFADVRALGCDLSTEGLGLAKSRGGRRLAQSSIGALPFRGGSLDVITCADVLQHLAGREVDESLAEFHRVLRRGGFLLLRAAARRGIGRKKHRDDAGYQQWEPQKLRAAVERHGFETVFLTLVNWLPSLWADLKAWLRPAPEGDQGLTLQPLPEKSPRSLLLAAYWNMERRLVLDAGRRPPGGHTVFCVARKR